MLNTVECRYKAIQYNVLYMLLQQLGQNLIRIEFTKGTPYLALAGELWGVFCEDLEENWLCHNGNALYKHHKKAKLEVVDQ